MQATVTEDFAQNASFAAAQAELRQHVGLDAKVKLVPFVKDELLNPEALALMERTAHSKYTQDRYAALTERYAGMSFPARPSTVA